MKTWCIALMTLNSAFLFCFLAISISLFPFTIPRFIVDKFMLSDIPVTIAILLGCYLLLLGLFLAGVHTMKYVMAVFCGAGLALVSLLVLSAVLKGLSAESLTGFLVVLLFSIGTIITNVLWFIAAFRNAYGVKE